VLWETSRVARFFYEKALGGQPGAREVIARIPEEQAVIVFAGDGDIISVHEDVARLVFPTIARNRAAWAEASWEVPAEYHEAPPALSFDDWA
jgi:hypothetical protein